MRDHLVIAESPADETCAGVGSIDYPERSRAECKALIGQLRRELGEEVASAKLGVKSFPHDFGEYRQVVCYFDDQDEPAMEYAYKCEAKLPERWDEQAKQELAEAGFPVS